MTTSSFCGIIYLEGEVTELEGATQYRATQLQSIHEIDSTVTTGRSDEVSALLIPYEGKYTSETIGVSNITRERYEGMKKVKQVIEQESQETSINIDYYGRILSIYTTKATVINRMSDLGYEPIETHTMDGEICDAYYEFPTKDIGKFLRTGLFKFD